MYSTVCQLDEGEQSHQELSDPKIKRIKDFEPKIQRIKDLSSSIVLNKAFSLDELENTGDEPALRPTSLGLQSKNKLVSSYSNINALDLVDDLDSRIKQAKRPRTAILIKVRIERRPVGRGEINAPCENLKQGKVTKPQSVEEEVASLVAEVKAATGQIKKDVKQIRQSDSPTPDTPTPLREFRDLIMNEEENESLRLPTITELHKESEEDIVNRGKFLWASMSMIGRHHFQHHTLLLHIFFFFSIYVNIIFFFKNLFIVYL